MGRKDWLYADPNWGPWGFIARGGKLDERYKKKFHFHNNVNNTRKRDAGSRIWTIMEELVQNQGICLIMEP